MPVHFYHYISSRRVVTTCSRQRGAQCPCVSQQCCESRVLKIADRDAAARLFELLGGLRRRDANGLGACGHGRGGAGRRILKREAVLRLYAEEAHRGEVRLRVRLCVAQLVANDQRREEAEALLARHGADRAEHQLCVGSRRVGHGGAAHVLRGQCGAKRVQTRRDERGKLRGGELPEALLLASGEGHASVDRPVRKEVGADLCVLAA
mmetsp:Transcript_44717/g.140814  ORF Transcript_44717/g.140814 Transcript_44717/m.140814 type:complete len:208 (+) Transcript_44717:58-681(+)